MGPKAPADQRGVSEERGQKGAGVPWTGDGTHLGAREAREQGKCAVSLTLMSLEGMVFCTTVVDLYTESKTFLPLEKLVCTKRTSHRPPPRAKYGGSCDPGSLTLSTEEELLPRGEHQDLSEHNGWQKENTSSWQSWAEIYFASKI